MAQAQSYLLKVADRKNLSNEVRAMLAKGISELYSNSNSIMNQYPFSKLIEEKTKIYIAFKKKYYYAISLLKYKDHLLEHFQKTGEGYGKVVAFFNIADQSLSEPIKDLV